jgi:hypothetical protein
MGIAKRYRLRGTHHADRHGLRGTHSRCVTLMSAELQNAAFGLIACRIPTMKQSNLLTDIQSWFDVNKHLLGSVVQHSPYKQTPPPCWAYQAKSCFHVGSFKKLMQAKIITDCPLHPRIPSPFPHYRFIRHNY